jgi:hypothetical protein
MDFYLIALFTGVLLSAGGEAVLFQPAYTL